MLFNTSPFLFAVTVTSFCKTIISAIGTLTITSRPEPTSIVEDLGLYKAYVASKLYFPTGTFLISNSPSALDKTRSKSVSLTWMLSLTPIKGKFVSLSKTFPRTVCV